MSLKKILLVEDDRAYNMLNKIFLKDNGIDCEIDEALNGKEAMKFLAVSQLPDVILLDINMPVMDGYEFLAEVEKQLPETSTIHVFMLSSSDRDEDKERSLKSKLVKGYFVKPLCDTHLKQIIATVNGKEGKLCAA